MCVEYNGHLFERDRGRSRRIRDASVYICAYCGRSVHNNTRFRSSVEGFLARLARHGIGPCPKPGKLLPKGPKASACETCAHYRPDGARFGRCVRPDRPVPEGCSYHAARAKGSCRWHTTCVS